MQLSAPGRPWISGTTAAVVAAMRMAREIGAGNALKEWRTREIAPGPDVRTDAEVAEYAKRTLLSYHHQAGTCRMGIDRMAVTGPDLTVHGTEGLRVADSSVMPAVTSGNTNAATLMIGERCADFLLGRPGPSRAASPPSRAASSIA